MNEFIKMDSVRWQIYKRIHNTIPQCVACGVHILINDKCTASTGRLTKYFCEKCSNKNIIVYQYPIRRYGLVQTKKDIRVLMIRR